jgi:tetratricopeptide (TPR) repeat protein
MSLNLRQLIEDEDLQDRLETIEKVMKENYLPAWYIHFPHYTDHGVSHCESVESNLNELIPDGIKNNLNEYEIFLLLCAVWLHDIGMTSFEKCEDITREKHHELGRILIRNDKINGIRLNEHEKVVVGELVFGHCAQIDQIEEITRIERLNNKSEIIRIKYLACLLRLADVCDVSHNRTHDVILASEAIDPISKVHHELHQRITSIEFDIESNKIIVYATVKSEKDKELLEKTIINYIQKELCVSSKILHPKITYNYVFLKLNYDNFKKEIHIPPEFYQNLGNNYCFKCAKKLGPSQMCEQYNQQNSELNIGHFDEGITDKSKITLLHGSSDVDKLQEIFSSRWITTFNVIETRSFKEIKKSLEDGLPVIIVGNRDSGKTSFIYAMLKVFLLDNWHVAVYEKDETLKDEDFESNSPLLIAIDDLHAFEITEQDEIFKLYKKAMKNKSGFLASYRLENENNIGHLWINEISHINTKCVLPDLSKNELKEIIKVHAKEKELKISDENIEQFAWKVSKYSNMPAHIAYSFLSKEKGDIISLDEIEKIPPELNKLIEDIIIKLDIYGEKIMAIFKIFNAIDGGDSRFLFKDELKFLFSKNNDSFSDVGFSRGINSLIKLGIIQEIDSSILTTPKEGFLDQISLEFKNIDIDALKNSFKNEYLNLLKLVDLSDKEDNLTYSLALLSNYERIKKLEIPVVDFVNILLSKNKELSRSIIFKKVFDEPKDIQRIYLNLILPYIKDLKDKNCEDLFQLAIIYEHIDEIDNEIEILNEILLKCPENPHAYHRLGHIYSDLEKYPQAIENMEKAANLDPKYYYCLGIIHNKAGDDVKAIEFINKSPDEKIKEEKNSALGLIFNEQKKYTEAIDHMKKAADLNPKYLNSLGKIYANAGKVENAMESFNRGIEFDSEDASIYHSLGHIFSNEKKNGEAILNMEKAANLDPKYFDCLGDIYSKAEFTEKAIESYNKAIEYDSKNAETYHRLGHIYSDLKKYPQAIENMEKAANLNPKYFDCLSIIYYITDYFKKAVESLNKLIENNLDDAKTYDLLGHIYANKFYNYDEAINYFNKCIKMNPQSIEQKSNLLEALLGAGRYDEVNSYATEILEISKNNVLNLNVRCIVLCSKFFDGNKDVTKLVSEFMEYYNELPENFDIDWNYDSIINMMKKRDFSKNNRDILISLINLLIKNISIDEFKKICPDFK